jgi:hypothetical protein
MGQKQRIDALWSLFVSTSVIYRLCLDNVQERRSIERHDRIC